MTLVYILLAAILGVSGYMAWKMSIKSKTGVSDSVLIEEIATVKAELGQRQQEIGELKKTLEREQSEKNKMAGQNEKMTESQMMMKEEAKALRSEKEAMQKRIAKFESEELQRKEKFETEINQLVKAEESFKEERQRVIVEEQDRLQSEEEMRDRLWAEHENTVISAMTSLCKMPQYGFKHFTNTSLPDGFDGSLKPDFLIEFLDQYMIFDAKVSKADNLQTYINATIKSTTTKVKKNTKIFPHIFLVVPRDRIGEVKSTIYSHDEFTYYVINTESLPPIMSWLKRISTYELAETMDPQKRENIINLLAEMDSHINLRNAADIFFAKAGTNVIEKTKKVDPELMEEVAMRKAEMKIPSLNDLKKLALNPEAQNNEISELVSPKPSVRQKDITHIKDSIIQKLLN